jgi:SAM-dependent methyltransferase
MTAPGTTLPALAALASPDSFRDPHFVRLAFDIYTGEPREDSFEAQPWARALSMRKVWETTQVALGLEMLGLVEGGKTGLGVGVGDEPLTFWLARRCAHIYGTDLFGFDWCHATLDVLHSPQTFAPYPYPADRLTMLQMDGQNLLLPPDSVDFVWSISTIEHFDGFAGFVKHLEECRKVLRPGGVVAFSTEMALNSARPPQFCLTAERLSVIIDLAGMEPVFPFDGNVHPELLSNPAHVRMPEWKFEPQHWDRLSVSLNGLIVTSVTMFLRKPS